MLVLTRKEDQAIVFPGHGIIVHVLSVKGRTIKLGVEAPKDIDVLRGELVHDSITNPSLVGFQITESSPGHNSAENVDKQIHELKDQLKTVTHSIQRCNDQKLCGKKEATSKALNNLLAALTEIDNQWSSAGQNASK